MLHICYARANYSGIPFLIRRYSPPAQVLVYRGDASQRSAYAPASPRCRHPPSTLFLSPEAGGHNGREETTTLCLIPAVRAVTSLPLIAAGGIATGEAILAMRALGADGVQVGTRFALTEESSASEVFKEYCLHLK